MILYDNPQTRVAIGSPHAQQDAMIDGEEPADCVSSFRTTAPPTDLT
jgi:hypothetical protein